KHRCGAERLRDAPMQCIRPFRYASAPLPAFTATVAPAGAPAASWIPPMTDPLAALLLGILEGLTEFLPISSTGHLLIAQYWLGARSDFFNIVIQAGAILAVTLVFRERIWSLATGLGEATNRD